MDENAHRQFGPMPRRVRLLDGSEHELAKPGARLIARILDQIMISIAAAVVLLFFGGAVSNDIADDSAGTGLFVFSPVFVLSILGLLIYEVSLTAIRGQTLGKQIMSIKVVSITDGLVPGWGKSFGRWVIPAVLAFIPVIGLVGLVGYLALLWDRNRQTWYDKAAGTAVIKVPRQRF